MLLGLLIGKYQANRFSNIHSMESQTQLVNDMDGIWMDQVSVFPARLWFKNDNALNVRLSQFRQIYYYIHILYSHTHILSVLENIGGP